METNPDFQTSSIDAFDPYEMARKAEKMMVAKVQKPFSKVFIASTYGGFFIGLAFVFYTLVTTGSSTMPYGMAKLVGGLCFSMGLILVIVCGADLFTSTTLTFIAKESNKITWFQLFRNWGIVYFGNFIGALFLVFLVYMSGHPWGADGQIAVNYMNIVEYKLHHSFIEAIALGILCNVMVSLGVWLCFSCRTSADKVLVLLLPIAMFVACGFEHCVANMYEIPMGILIRTTTDPGFWVAHGINVAQYSDITWGDFIIWNLVPVTIGNIIGGALLIGWGNWLLFLRRHTSKKRH
ncbi:formate transporter FocA [Commensalibacter papalotli (ex Botero et al. 2024)]|uniref:FNT family (FocA) (PDB:3KCU) n=1 Tax=Commensalibacter papalotli (ex Botero et al. 2024) TaxID=2972766 RepID=A0ABM9HLK0_9PROT|nr:formate transporter FocA [Commensalibacter papalotli (ex Botero et al. 2024)]CAI3934498.1 FNT family (FocA) (PDB:3KCU) [Commensalibacter papalotli (ex Botero et al. 2024)]CAI3950601.1 FNT family (FocA) (PDB:3KCU) [Commensalibacter papalotli (ex Botero et al. 2024)]